MRGLCSIVAPVVPAVIIFFIFGGADSEPGRFPVCVDGHGFFASIAAMIDWGDGFHERFGFHGLVGHLAPLSLSPPLILRAEGLLSELSVHARRILPELSVHADGLLSPLAVHGLLSPLAVHGLLPPLRVHAGGLLPPLGVHGLLPPLRVHAGGLLSPLGVHGLLPPLLLKVLCGDQGDVALFAQSALLEVNLVIYHKGIAAVRACQKHRTSMCERE